VPAKTQIVDGSGNTSSTAKVTTIGQLVTSPYDYNDASHQELGVADVAYNFYEPRHGMQFVVSGLVYSADQQVSNTTGATVVIYESDSDDSTTVDKVLHQDDLVKNDRVALIGINLLVNAGKFVNAKTDDDDIHMTILGYYIPELE